MDRKRVYRGEVWLADLSGKHIGSEQAGIRPVLIIQNDIGNKYSPTTIVAMITSKIKRDMPTHMDIELYEPSTILFEQLRTIDKQRLIHKITEIEDERVEEMEEKLGISLGLIPV